MSNVIRSSFSSPISRGIQYCTEADALLAANPRDLKALASLSEKIGRSIKSIRDLLAQWVAFLEKKEGAALTAENAIFDNFTSSERRPTEFVDVLEEKMVDLDLAIDELKAANGMNAAGGGGGGAGGGIPAAPPAQFMPLPKPHLLTFDGSIKDWPAFWQSFTDNVANNPTISDAQRLSFLIGQLKGSARDMAMGYPLVDGSYKSVVDSLKNRYGDSDKLKEELQREFLHLPMANMSPTSLRALLESVGVFNDFPF